MAPAVSVVPSGAWAGEPREGERAKYGCGTVREARRPLRVLLTTDAVGGVWDYSLTLACGLVATGEARALVAVIGPEPDAVRRRHAAGIDGLDIEVVGGRL